ncbi:Lysine acetyltransferase [Fulvia fulva]|uniref:Lysine acetyltransferase n=1 Tax=Passalora fulva TaxID=5499 RepID=A0A9Q8USZ7_PASFU|nr:Lysine acetyltransferase [Fulvia fulva]KAK4617802.1 Lysine acetyltransferase [Fulvia fulva]KAK4618958.1 Lysine acetyltransferase [Fulvia fulva]UJO21326.1 Lysine acetyltransferase [Fulvia fulva]WPV18195.1 Lysine acetyltransferase [Fulvia fulva]WPV32755.1 Lysine acetyltransferase [Fulvia fulva]
MDSTGLPSKESPDLRLVVATYEELIQQQHANSEEWRGALSHEQYLQRESILYDQDLTRDGGLTPWALVYQPDSNGPRQVLCGCETLNKRALVALDGKVEDVICHGVASVFCPPKYRGKGYAGRMMEDLGKKLRSWQVDNGKACLFSILYSDIGKEFYTARGWHPFPSAQIILPAAAEQSSKDARPLGAEELSELCTADEGLLRKKLSALKDAGRTVVATVPDHRTLAWHHAREDYVAKQLCGKQPHVKGAIVGDEPGRRVFAYWTRVWTNPQEDGPNTLHILRIVVEEDTLSDIVPASTEVVAKVKDSRVTHALAAVLSVAQSEAAKWDMKEVSIWNPTSATLAAAQLTNPSVAIQHREKESITSLQWYGETGSWQDIDWVCNEKYGWC